MGVLKRFNPGTQEWVPVVGPTDLATQQDLEEYATNAKVDAHAEAGNPHPQYTLETYLDLGSYSSGPVTIDPYAATNQRLRVTGDIEFNVEPPTSSLDIYSCIFIMDIESSYFPAPEVTWDSNAPVGWSVLGQEGNIADADYVPPPHDRLSFTAVIEFRRIPGQTYWAGYVLGSGMYVYSF